MTPSNFFQHVIELYHRASDARFPHARLFRGESHSIASSVEDLFAHYLINRLTDDCSVLINQNLSTHINGRRHTIKPDIAVVRGNMMSALFDLKMDLGYKRDSFASFWREWDARIQLLRGQVFSYNEKRGRERTGRSVTLAPTAMLGFVLVSDQNISRQTFETIDRMKAEMQNSRLFILSSGYHPNTYGHSAEEVLARLTVKDDEFSDLLKICN